MITARSVTLSVVGLATAGSLAAQTPARPPVTPSGALQAHLVAISVPDVPASIAWYRDKLGFELVRDTAFASYGVRIAELRRDAFHIELVQLDGSRAGNTLIPGLDNPALIQGFGKLAFRVPDVAAWATALEARGVTFILPIRENPADRSRSFIVRDNAGNWLQFVQTVP
jgi:methylmalonyl-CoA/ethylmalonyl-CoA epimerase